MVMNTLDSFFQKARSSTLWQRPNGIRNNRSIKFTLVSKIETMKYNNRVRV